MSVVAFSAAGVWVGDLNPYSCSPSLWILWRLPRGLFAVRHVIINHTYGRQPYFSLFVSMCQSTLNKSLHMALMKYT